MTTKTYSKEEQFLRELAQVCKRHNAGLLMDKLLGLTTTRDLEIDSIQIMANGKYVARTLEHGTIIGQVE